MTNPRRILWEPPRPLRREPGNRFGHGLRGAFAQEAYRGHRSAQGAIRSPPSPDRAQRPLGTPTPSTNQQRATELAAQTVPAAPETSTMPNVSLAPREPTILVLPCVDAIEAAPFRHPNQTPPATVLVPRRGQARGMALSIGTRTVTRVPGANRCPRT